MPVAPFIAQVQEFNSYVRGKDDKQFHRPLQLAIVIDKPPFYAVRVWPKVHYCMGGAAINEKAEVMDVMGKTIPGLFAAGEVTGGIHGASRLGGCAIADGLCFGRIAGESAAKNSPVKL